MKLGHGASDEVAREMLVLSATKDSRESRAHDAYATKIPHGMGWTTFCTKKLSGTGCISGLSTSLHTVLEPLNCRLR
jgi:hypothetical protein